MKPDSLNFQQLILRLHQFWGERGCLIWQPYSEKVGAGTMNPATVINVLGPEPWNVGYAEPSYRPDDGRFGENPNRMQMHTQYQVILKPDPGNPQEIYLESLRAIGINTDEHDIRFVEDNWESPALGAWGLGWEVWLDGLEITQFTYFQQAASHVLDTPAVEITYGLERIAIFLQGVRQVWDLRWDENLTYGEILLQNEIDHCKYDFDVANVDTLLSLYGLYESEARLCIQNGLVVPAHDSVLRCSHTFNVLDARGAIGVTERAAYFAKMRDLSRQLADIYLKQREEKGFPLLAKLKPRPEVTVPAWGPGPAGDKADFLLEVGVEELPPDELLSAIGQLETAFQNLLKEHRLEHDSLWVSGTPRRLVVRVGNLASRQPDRSVEVKGPPANRAFDEQGNLTQTGLGFAKSNNVDAKELQTRTEGNKSYVVATRFETGQEAGAVLAGLLGKVIGSLKWRKSMRWDSSGVAFSRPVRWLLALHGSAVVPFQFAHQVSGRTTFAPRPLYSVPAEVSSVADYLDQMQRWQVLIDRDERKRTVLDQVTRTAAQIGGQVPAEPALLDEVTDLVECPVAVLGRFEEERLSLPAPVLKTVMKKHQRYFPVQTPEGQVMNAFVAVSNGQRGDMTLVRRGNEDVLRARYADAAYFVKDDLQHKLEDFLPRLATLTFQEKLGSMADKAGRMEKLLGSLGLDPAEHAQAARVCRLCKADLVTSMVVEMTSLQGILGEIYARHSGEDAEVAQAIREHYLPRSAGDETPKGRLGALVGLMDRVDSLAGLFAIGLKPTGSADPYGLRRTAVGLVNLLVETKTRIDLRQLLAASLQLQPVPGTDKTLGECMGFVADRMSVWLKEQGAKHDAVEAIVAARAHDPYGAFLALGQLTEAVKRDNWGFLLASYSRCRRITKDLKETLSLNGGHYAEDVARQLHDSLVALPPAQEVGELIHQLDDLAPKIEAFFDGVLVNAEDPAVRQARLALVQKVASLADGLVDFSRLEGY